MLQGFSDCVAAAVALMGLHDLSDLASETVCATVIAVTPLGIEGHITLCDTNHEKSHSDSSSQSP